PPRPPHYRAQLDGVGRPRRRPSGRAGAGAGGDPADDAKEDPGGAGAGAGSGRAPRRCEPGGGGEAGARAGLWLARRRAAGRGVMGGTDWMPGIVALSVGAVLGLILALRARRSTNRAAAAPEERDLDAGQEILMGRLRELS